MTHYGTLGVQNTKKLEKLEEIISKGDSYTKYKVLLSVKFITTLRDIQQDHNTQDRRLPVSETDR